MFCFSSPPTQQYILYLASLCYYGVFYASASGAVLLLNDTSVIANLFHDIKYNKYFRSVIVKAMHAVCDMTNMSFWQGVAKPRHGDETNEYMNDSCFAMML